MSETNPIDRELDRLRELLVTAIGKNRYTIRGLERHLGLGVGTLRRTLNGEVPLTLRQLLAVVRALGLRWEDFFAAAYPIPGEAAASLEAGAKTPTLAEVEEEVRALLLRFLPPDPEEPPSGPGSA